MGHNVATRLRTALGVVAAIALTAHTAIGYYSSHLSLISDSLFSWQAIQSSVSFAEVQGINIRKRDCLSRLQDIEWRNVTADGRTTGGALLQKQNVAANSNGVRIFGVKWSFEETVVPASQAQVDNSELETRSRVWDWRSSERRCSFVRLRGQALRAVLKDAWIVVSGDSQTRLLVISLLQMMMPSAPPPLFKKHSDVHNYIAESNTTVDFIWSPYPSNITTSIQALTTDGSCPHTVVLGSGLWHMLWFTDALEYERSLEELRGAVSQLRLCKETKQTVSSKGPMAARIDRPPLFVWVGLPTLLTAELNTVRKRQVMTHYQAGMYHKALHASGLVGANRPCLEIEMDKLSRGCGRVCTKDGMHYDNATFEAAVSILVNMMILWDSYMRLCLTMVDICVLDAPTKQFLEPKRVITPPPPLSTPTLGPVHIMFDSK